MKPKRAGARFPGTQSHSDRSSDWLCWNWSQLRQTRQSLNLFWSQPMLSLSFVVDSLPLSVASRSWTCWAELTMIEGSWWTCSSLRTSSAPQSGASPSSWLKLGISLTLDIIVYQFNNSFIGLEGLRVLLLFLKELRPVAQAEAQVKARVLRPAESA